MSRVKLLKKMISESCRRRKLLEREVACVLLHQGAMMKAIFVVILLLLAEQNTKVYHRSCKRLERNRSWWDLVWNGYSNQRFKKTCRVSRETFYLILSETCHKLERQGLSEEPICPEFHLGICLYRLGRVSLSIGLPRWWDWVLQ